MMSRRARFCCLSLSFGLVLAAAQFHGVPEGEHPWVNTPRERFEKFMKYLHDHKFNVIALRDLSQYVNRADVPDNPMSIIERRIQILKTKD